MASGCCLEAWWLGLVLMDGRVRVRTRGMELRDSWLTHWDETPN